MIPIHNVMGTHVLKMDSLLLQELKGLVYILQTVDAHPSLCGFRLERENRGRDSLSSMQRPLLRTTLNHTCSACVLSRQNQTEICVHSFGPISRSLGATAAIHKGIGEDQLTILNVTTGCSGLGHFLRLT